MSKARKRQEGDERGWTDQFLLSLKQWSTLEDKLKDPHNLDTLTRPLDDGLHGLSETAPVGEHPEQDELFLAAFRAIFHQYIDIVQRDVEAALMKCESPIEPPMLYALTIVARGLGSSVCYLVDGFQYGEQYEPIGTLYIEPQAQLGQHRVDFLLTYKETVPDFSKSRKLPNGTEIPGSKEVTKKMVIECDGHDFHDRTREQARKDRQRDRMLQSLGSPVYRYTGSEIWADVFKCAHEAMSGLVKQALQEWGPSAGE